MYIYSLPFYLLPISTPTQSPTRNYWPSEGLPKLPTVHNIKKSVACYVAKMNPPYPSSSLVPTTFLPLIEIKFTDTPPYFDVITITCIFTPTAMSSIQMEMVKTCYN